MKPYTTRNMQNYHPLALLADLGTKNRKLILQEYDDMGNLVETRELSEWHLKSVLSVAYNYGKDIDVLPCGVKKLFSDEEWQLIALIAERLQTQGIDFEHADNIKTLRDILDHNNRDRIQFACNMCYDEYKNYINNMEHEQGYTYVEFFEAMKFIAANTGIYYAVNNEGTKTCNFVTAPTKKQAAYRRKKYGDRVVFLSFEDWKEYAVSEQELSN